MYYLDFTTVIQLLKEFRRSGVLRAELPKGLMNTQETCWIQLKLLQGEITDCQIIANRGGTIVADKDVLREVERLGPLEWMFGPLKGSPTLPKKAPDNNSSSPPLSVPISLPSLAPSLPSNQLSSFLFALVPRRLTIVEQHLLNALTRQQRRVLALVDGKRNISQITALLFSSSSIESGVEEVLTLFQELDELRIIELG